jgi:hypothetical protein
MSFGLRRPADLQAAEWPVFRPEEGFHLQRRVKRTSPGNPKKVHGCKTRFNHRFRIRMGPERRLLRDSTRMIS